MAVQANPSRRICARFAIPLAVVGAALALGLRPRSPTRGTATGIPRRPGTATARRLHTQRTATPGRSDRRPLRSRFCTPATRTAPTPIPGRTRALVTDHRRGTGTATDLPSDSRARAAWGRQTTRTPPGQFPDGSDPNAGYECDTNNGIGQTNPAHTGCVSTPPTPVTPPVVVTPPVAPKPPGALVTPASLPSIPSVSLPAAAGGALPVTGGDVLILVLVALGAIAAGGGMTVIARHRLTRA
jgi:hypothetical protein